MILLESSETGLAVSESIVWLNAEKTAFYNPKGGTARFYIPPASGGKVRVMCTHPARTGVAVERAPEKTATANVITVDWPVKPGETRFDLTYSLPGTKFATKIVHGGGPVRLVTPPGVTIQGEGVKFLDKHPESQASIYDFPGTDLAVDVIGTGTLRPTEGESDGEDSPGLQQIRPRLYDRFRIILGLTLFILALGMVLLYRKRTAA
jgi:hypothetical protein